MKGGGGGTLKQEGPANNNQDGSHIDRPRLLNVRVECVSLSRVAIDRV